VPPFLLCMFRRPWTGVGVGPVPNCQSSHGLRCLRGPRSKIQSEQEAESRPPLPRRAARKSHCHCCRAQGHSPSSSCLLPAFLPFRFLWVKSPSPGFNLKRAGEAKKAANPIRLITTATGRPCRGVASCVPLPSARAAPPASPGGRHVRPEAT